MVIGLEVGAGGVRVVAVGASGNVIAEAHAPIAGYR
jgi:ribulose kinase